MIIPIRCMGCGNVIADKWRYYQKALKQLREQRGLPDAPMVLDGTGLPDTPEKQVMDTLGFTRSCCRKHFLTHRDLIDKI